MSASQIGERFKVSTFGESHGRSMGCLIDGCPSGVLFDAKLLEREMQRRRPGIHTGSIQNELVSERTEVDAVEVHSGIFEGKTLGTPILMLVKNQDTRSEDYDDIKTLYRTGHADQSWQNKFGVRDHRGGGRASGRETAARVMAGALAQMLVKQLAPATDIYAYTLQLGPLFLADAERELMAQGGHKADEFFARFPSPQSQDAVRDLLLMAKQQGKSYGGTVELRVKNMPMGLGQPVFHKFRAELSSYLMGIGATIGVEFGYGFAAAFEEGSEFHKKTQSMSQYGGDQGGITTGQDLIVRLAFKPTSSVLDVAKKGRHDPCIVPRAIPVVEAMTWILIADHLLWQRTDRV